MQLPRNLLSGSYYKPRLFLCESDKTRICKLETFNTNATFKFNSYSELSFEVDRVYNDVFTGETKLFPFYDKIEAVRLIEVEGFGFFELQAPELVSDGIRESKSCTAYSLEYTLSQKYLEDFYVNTGEIGSVEVSYAEDTYSSINPDLIQPVVLYDTECKELSLLHLVLEKIYGWEIGHVDLALHDIKRTFEVERESVYDFLMNEVCEKFNCYIVFDTTNTRINVYAESLSQTPPCDGTTSEFILDPPFAEIGTVSIDGYKTTDYTYDPIAGKLVLGATPEKGALIEVVDGALSAWETDVFISFDNLSQELNVNYNADEIKTVLTVRGADDLDIREVNMGLPYIVDLSYFHSADWMGQDLYDAYNNYLADYNASQTQYQLNSQKINELNNEIAYEQTRMSLDDIGIVVLQQNIDKETVGQYFVRGGTAPNYYYIEKTLPEDYNAEDSYYLFEGEGINLTETDVSYLYEALQEYLRTYFNDQIINMEKLDECSERFLFVQEAFDNMCEVLRNIDQFDAPSDVIKNYDTSFMFECVNEFLDTMWNQLGSYPLQYCYKQTYVTLQTTAMEAGWGSVDSAEYGNYLAVYILVQSIERALETRNNTISDLKTQMSVLQESNSNIASSLEMYTYFKTHYPDNYKQFMFRFSAFLREDEYIDDNFVQTGQETLEELYQIKRELKECGKIELSKLCKPKLQFSMTMANIYALPEFAPIVKQFQLGNVIKVGIRKGYINQARLLQVNINFDNFADFSCEFGELTDHKTQSDIHADLLSQAISAGKSVASNASYWNKGANQANNIDLRIQRGLLDAATSIKSMDGNQGVEIDNYGVHLRKVDPSTQEFYPEQGWITNNKFLYSSDGFKTVNSVFGKYKIDDVEYWGLLAKAVVAGYIEGSDMVGGTIKIGLQDDGSYAFEVHPDGSVTMSGGSSIDGYVKEEDVTKIYDIVDDINKAKMHTVEIITEDPTVISYESDTATMTCKVYAWGTDITETIDARLFNWKRASNNTELDAVWNAMPEHQGVKSITINSDDVIENSSFICEVDLPE